MRLIPVIYVDKKPGMVLPTSLDKLIASNTIIAFRRSDGWVFLGEDLLRTNEYNDDYDGLERRIQPDFQFFL